MAVSDWRRLLRLWQDEGLKTDVQKIAALTPEGHRPLGNHPMFHTTVEALDRLMVRAAHGDGKLREFLGDIVAKQACWDFFWHLGGLAEDVEDVISSFAGGWEGGGGSLDCVVLVTLVENGQEQHCEPRCPDAGATPSDIRENVAKARGCDPSQLIVTDVPLEKWLKPIREFGQKVSSGQSHCWLTKCDSI